MESVRQEGGGRVDLVAPARFLPAPGQELSISYGDKSNEELLFLYGERLSWLIFGGEWPLIISLGTMCVLVPRTCVGPCSPMPQYPFGDC